MIKAETLIQAQKEEQQQVESFTSSNQQTLEERVAFLENLMRKHLHNGLDGSKRIGGIWKRLSEKILNAASSSVQIDIPEGYRIYRLTCLGGLSTPAYLRFTYNTTTSSYVYSLSVFQAGTFDGDSTSTGTTTDTSAKFAFWGGTDQSMNHNAELTLYDPPTFVNTYRTWFSRGQAQSLNGLQAQSFLASGTLADTNSKLKYLTISPSTGNINADTVFILEGLTV